MIAKYWKKIGLIILIIACLFNIVNKIVDEMLVNRVDEQYKEGLLYLKKII